MGLNRAGAFIIFTFPKNSNNLFSSNIVKFENFIKDLIYNRKKVKQGPIQNYLFFKTLKTVYDVFRFELRIKEETKLEINKCSTRLLT